MSVPVLSKSIIARTLYSHCCEWEITVCVALMHESALLCIMRCTRGARGRCGYWGGARGGPEGTRRRPGRQHIYQQNEPREPPTPCPTTYHNVNALMLCMSLDSFVHYSHAHLRIKIKSNQMISSWRYVCLVSGVPPSNPPTPFSWY